MRSPLKTWRGPAIALVALAFSPRLAGALPADGIIEGPHGNVPGFPVNSCYVCHDIVDGTTGRDAVRLPNDVCLGCHTDGPTFGTDDPIHQERPRATAVGNHVSLVTGSTRFTYGDSAYDYPYVEHEQEIHCTTCHDPHQTYDLTDPSPSTNNIMYVRDHTDDYQVDTRGLVQHYVYKDIRVIDNTGSTPVEFIKRIDQDIVYTTPGAFADGFGLGALEADVCQVCHTETEYHRVNDTAPGGNSHYAGEVCTSCHSHDGGFGPSGGQPLTGPHAVFGNADCGSCHDSSFFPGGADNPVGLASVFCGTCHDPATVADLHSHTVTGSTRFDYSIECTTCHDQHGWELTNVEGTENTKYIKARITEQIDVVDHTADDALVSKSIDNDVVFTGVFNDADGVFTDDICSTCHTLTNHHQNDGTAPGGQSHFDGERCTSCHSHPGGFGAADGPHPQAISDCSNCHWNAEGQPDLAGIHGNDCASCHPTGFAGTILGPVGSWDMECSGCHNPGVSETGNFATPTKGHRCVACHGQQRNTGELEDLHKRHTDAANCVVCHGFIPDMGVVIGSANLEVCQLCHDGGKNYSRRKVHKKHTKAGLSCIECHGGVRPPVGIDPGTPVGSATTVCQVCHNEKSSNSQRLHEKHTDNKLDCGSCHRDANLQDDRLPMLAIDDSRRAQVDRSGWNECALCHRDESASSRFVHEEHAGEQWQWCYNCHEGYDTRPIGLTGPVTEPADSCDLCHGGRHYSDAQPFSIHLLHSQDAKCYTCHQANAPLTDWPAAWLGTFTKMATPQSESAAVLPKSARLMASPNPFNPATTLTYAVDQAGPVSLIVYDVRGRWVDNLVDHEHRDAGEYRHAFRPDLPSGVYFVRFVTAKNVATKKIVLTK